MMAQDKDEDGCTDTCAALRRIVVGFVGVDTTGDGCEDSCMEEATLRHWFCSGVPGKITTTWSPPLAPNEIATTRTAMANWTIVSPVRQVRGPSTSMEMVSPMPNAVLPNPHAAGSSPFDTGQWLSGHVLRGECWPLMESRPYRHHP